MQFFASIFLGTLLAMVMLFMIHFACTSITNKLTSETDMAHLLTISVVSLLASIALYNMSSLIPGQEASRMALAITGALACLSTLCFSGWTVAAYNNVKEDKDLHLQNKQ